MKNNFQKIPLLLSAGFLVLLCLAFWFLYKQINNNNQRAGQSFTTWQTEQQRREDIKSLEQSLKKMEGDRVQLETHFAQSSDIVPFLDMIEKLGTLAGTDTQVDSVDTSLDHTELLAGLKVAGSFESIYKFLTLLENSPYELDFSLVDIHKVPGEVTGGKDTKSYKWEAVFKMKLLSFIP